MSQSEPKSLGFTKQERLLKPSEFAAVRRSGKRYSTPGFVIYVLPNGLGLRRLGLSVGSKTGGAVRRNRVKRLVRESFRLNKDAFPGSSDILIATRGPVKADGLKEVSAELYRAFGRNIGKGV